MKTKSPEAGQMTSVRSGDNSGPLPPQQATLDLLVASSKDTDPGALSGVTGAGAHLGVWGRSESSREPSELVWALG
jgi:hypothetical protein